MRPASQLPPAGSSPLPRKRRPAARRRGLAGALRLRCLLRCLLRPLVGIGLLGLVAQAQAQAGGAAPEPLPQLFAQQMLLVGARDGVVLHATPGRDNELSLQAQCFTMPPNAWCNGGTLVARFAAHPTQLVRRAWTDSGGSCVINDFYLACPLTPSPDRSVQTVRFTLAVAPREYSTDAATAQGADGLALLPTSFLVEMRGEGALELRPPRDIQLSAGHPTATTSLFLRNAGPSSDRGVTIRIGPFPDYLRPLAVGDPWQCTARQDMLECAPFELDPQIWQELPLLVQADASRLPGRLPVYPEITIEVRSDLASTRTRFVSAVVPDERAR